MSIAENKNAEDREIDILALLGVLWSNWKLLAALTTVLSVIFVTFILSLPSRFTEQLTLNITQNPVSLLGTTEGFSTVLNASQVKNSAVEHLQQTELEGVSSVNASYDSSTQEIQVVLQSQNREALKAADARLVADVRRYLRDVYKGTLDTAIETKVNSLKRQTRIEEEALETIKQELKKVHDDRIGSGSDENVARLQGLETERAALLGESAETTAEIRELKDEQNNTKKLAAELFVVRSEGANVTQDQSRIAQIALAVLFSLLVAITTVLFREALLRRRK